jgi:MFS family permease
MKSVLRLLRAYPKLRPVMLARAQSEIGSAAALIALVLTVSRHFHSPWALSALLLTESIPGVLAAPLLGAVADRYGRKRVAVGADCVRCGVYLGIAFSSSLAPILALVLVDGLAASAYLPAISAALPASVAPPDRAAVASISTLGYTIGQTVGPLFAAVLLVALGTRGVLLVNSATFLTSAALVGHLSLDSGTFKAARQTGRRIGARSHVTELRRQIAVSLGHFRGNPTLTVMLVGLFWVVLFASIPNVAEVILITRTLHGSNSMYAILAAGMSLGLLLGGLYCAAGAGARRLLWRFTIGGVGFGITFVACALAQQVWLIMLPFLAMGFANALLMVSRTQFTLAVVPDSELASVMAVFQSALNAALLAGRGAAGGLIAGLGARGAYWVAGGGCIAVALACGWPLLSRHVSSVKPDPIVPPTAN